MPAKYHIHTEPAPPRFRPVGKLGIVDWREDCSSCHNCVKRSCVYGLYRDEADALHGDLGYLDYIYQCKGCLHCIQNCTKNILTRVVNPEYERLGDDYFTPQIVLSTWFQASTGSIPVSGAGYGGPFSGPGFDSMWTDMSEIVRPTRDGIHGREYISTNVDIGRKLKQLSFEDGALTVEALPLLECPMPLIFDVIPDAQSRGPVLPAVVKAAQTLGLFAIVGEGDLTTDDTLASDRVIPLLSGSQQLTTDNRQLTTGNALAMVPDGENVADQRAALKAGNPEQLVAVRVTASPQAAARAVELARDGVEVIHLVFSANGREEAEAPAKPRHARDVLREVHGALLEDGTRDQVTLISSGGIALPEHMAKAIICGADLIAIDRPLLLAMECRLCGDCERGLLCPVELEASELDFATRRICNLMGAWHNQLLELLGAMGIRDVRRLRGETGRAMFFENLERETFGRLFGKRKNEYEA